MCQPWQAQFAANNLPKATPFRHSLMVLDSVRNPEFEKVMEGWAVNRDLFVFLIE